MDKKRLIVIDGNAIVHRAYHALPPLTTKKGELVNAVYGFLLFFFKSLKEFKPDFIAATFDLPAPTFRHEKYKEYKAKRKKAPDDLYPQIPKIKGILEKFGIQIFEKQGYEADDVIGTISFLAQKDKDFKFVETIILSGDLDTLQLINKNTKVYALKRGIKDAVLYGEEKVKERYQGLGPKELIDFKSLRGDPSDNIPGILGIGEKTAISLLKEFGTLENLYKETEEHSEKADKINGSLRKKLQEYKEKALMSKMLARIEKNVPLPFDLGKCRWKDYDRQGVVKILEEYGFKSLVERLPGFDSSGQFLPEKTKEKKSRKETIKNNLSLW